MFNFYLGIIYIYLLSILISEESEDYEIKCNLFTQVEKPILKLTYNLLSYRYFM